MALPENESYPEYHDIYIYIYYILFIYIYRYHVCLALKMCQTQKA